MIYNYLLYLLIVIVILNSKTVQEVPQIPFLYALLFFILKGSFYILAVRLAFKKRLSLNAANYFNKEQKFIILAILLFALDVYLLDCLHYFDKLPLTSQLPFLVSIGGLLLFLCYLSILWDAARTNYSIIFGRVQSRRSFIVGNLKNILVIILPWLILSILSDILQLLDVPIIKGYLSSPWGEPTILVIFFLVLLTVFPLMATKLWGCTPLPQGATRQHIEQFCRRQRLPYRDILLWPLFEGKVLTAGVLGFIKKFRYLLITPAMLVTMTPDEIEAVMAHEIGHVKKYHLQLYLVLFLGFILLVQFSVQPLVYLLLNSNFFYKIVFSGHQEPRAVLTFGFTIFTLTLILVYFRFIFGFFMRNFERQADIYALETTGHSGPIVSVFEKIARLSGNIRDMPSWHHFSIAQRVSFLNRSEADSRLIAKHNRKVYVSLVCYLLFIAISSFSLWRMPLDFNSGGITAQEFIEDLVKNKIHEEPQNPLWHHYLGDLKQTKQRYGEAIEAYEKALAIAPDSPDTLNNLAWLLLMAENKKLHNPKRALSLAKKAAKLKPVGYIFDTLAEAYWANNLPESAVATEKNALATDPENEEYYKKQLEKFTKQRETLDVVP